MQGKSLLTHLQHQHVQVCVVQCNQLVCSKAFAIYQASWNMDRDTLREKGKWVIQFPKVNYQLWFWLVLSIRTLYYFLV